MKCSKCGTELKKEDKFCSGCGAPIEEAQKRRMQFYESSDVKENASSYKGKENKTAGLYVIIAVLVFIVCVLIAVLVMSLAGNSAKKMKDEKNGSTGQSMENTESDIKTDEQGTAEDAKEESDADKTAGKSEDEEAEESAKDVDWQKLYLDFISGLNKPGNDAGYIGGGLLYVDDDDIPELYLEGDCEATGCLVLTCSSGEIEELQTSRCYFTYIEKGNLLNNSEGHMGYYYDYIYTIRNGKWESVAKGEYQEDYKGLDTWDYENGEPDYIYTWDGKAVKEAEYKKKLDAVYDSSKAKDAVKFSFVELESLIKTGKTSSAEHRYELIVDDLTWTEAERTCRQMGGYLATLTTKEEFDKVSRQIEAEGKTNISFFIGATRDSAYNTASSGELYGYFWIKELTATDYYSGDFAYWLSGEPSYTGQDADGNEVDEKYVDMVYRKSDGRYYLNDVADNILKEAPGFAGKIGYICEYE